MNNNSPENEASEKQQGSNDIAKSNKINSEKKNSQDNLSKPQKENDLIQQKIENSPLEEDQIKKITGPISNLLKDKGLEHKSMENDHIGIEIISIEPTLLTQVVLVLKDEGFNYLQCQGGYDEGPGKPLVCFYHLISIGDLTSKNKSIEKNYKVKEVRLKVFLPRDGNLSIPSLYKIFKGADWQERETFDMFGINFEGHPHPKRLLMPEDWKGWPLRKDYVQPDFYEMQDAY